MRSRGGWASGGRGGRRIPKGSRNSSGGRPAAPSRIPKGSRNSSRGPTDPGDLPISSHASRGIHPTGSARRDWEVKKHWEVDRKPRYLGNSTGRLRRAAFDEPPSTSRPRRAALDSLKPAWESRRPRRAWRPAHAAARAPPRPSARPSGRSRGRPTRGRRYDGRANRPAPRPTLSSGADEGAGEGAAEAPPPQTRTGTPLGLRRLEPRDRGAVLGLAAGEVLLERDDPAVGLGQPALHPLHGRLGDDGSALGCRRPWSRAPGSHGRVRACERSWPSCRRGSRPHARRRAGGTCAPARRGRRCARAAPGGRPTT